MADKIKASVKPPETITARTLTTVASRVSNLTDVDASELDLGSILVYNTNTEKWKATKELNQQNLDGGEF